MKPIWRAEVTVDPMLAKELVEAQFPQLAPVSARLLAAGWDNTAYVINDALIFRFPRRQIAVPLIQTESELLPWLSALVPLRIPVPSHVGIPSAAFEWPFLGYPVIAGERLPSARLSERDRMALAGPLAVFLRALHSIPADAARRHGAGPDVLDRLNTARRRGVTDERLSALVDTGAIDNRAQLEAILDSAPARATPRSDTLVHGDLHAGQMIVGRSREITGIIDWGDVHIGDPAVDLAAVHAVLPPASHDAFRRAYLPIDEPAWSAARARATWHSIMLLASAVDIDDRDMIREAKEALARLVKM